MRDLRQSRNYADYIGKIGWNVDEYKGVFLYINKLLFWNFVKVQRPFSDNFTPLFRFIKNKYRFSTIYVEPNTERQYRKLLNMGFRKYSSPFLPSKTVQIDLTKKEERLLKEMHKKTRYNIKIALRNKLNVSATHDIEQFADYWQKCATDWGMFFKQKNKIKAIHNSFGSKSMIHTVSDKKGNWLAAILRISAFNISYYLYAASTKEGNKLFAPTLVTWDAIKSARDEGNKIFDFEGIFDERFPLNTWKGFSRFKMGFGGRVVSYPGCLSKLVL